MTYKTPNGFTLVELAIVLMIIGLLIGGILKGQELIQNARIVSFARQIIGYRAAVITFQDSYGAKPGDITNPSTRLPNCSATPCSTAGTGDGRVVTTVERENAWRHLAKANLITGINADVATDYAVANTPYPGAVVGTATPVVEFLTPSVSWLVGSDWYYVWAMNDPNSGGMGDPFYPPLAAKVDRKMDDGIPNTGDVKASSSGNGSNNCTGTSGGIVTYLEMEASDNTCSLHIRQ